MTLPGQTTRWFRATLAVALLLTCLALSAKAQSDDQSAVKRVVEQLFAAIQREDLASVMALWSSKSPDLAANKLSMQQMFTAYRSVELKSLNLNKITVAAENASVQLVAELSVVDQPATASARPLMARWNIQLIREMGAWRVLKYVTAEEELAAVLIAAKTPEESQALLDAQPELVTTELVRALFKSVRGLSRRGKAGQEQALRASDIALSIAQRIKDKGGISIALKMKGDINVARGEHKHAKEFYDQSLKVAEELGDKIILAEVFTGVGVMYALQSDFPQSLDFLGRGLRIREEMGDKLNVSRELTNIGNIYVAQGDLVRALESFQRSLKLSEELGDKAGASATMNGIGNLYSFQGNYAQALDYYQQSLKIKQEIGDKMGEGRAFDNSGVVYASLGDYAQALVNLAQSLKIKEELGDKPGVVVATHNLAECYRLLGDYTRALEYEHRILKTAEELGNKELLGEILQNIGECYLRLGQPKTALEYANRGAALAAEFGIPFVLWIAKTTAGNANLALKQPGPARQDFLEAILTIEKLRGQVAGGERESQRFFENKMAPYHGMVELAVAENNPAEALSYAERAKGRVLLDVLRSGRTEVTKAMSTDELNRDRALVAEITALNTTLSRLKQTRPNDAQVSEIATQLDKARLEYEHFQTGLYAKHPDLKVKRGQTSLLSLEDVATLLPNRQTAILEYVVTQDKSYLFVIRKTSRTDVKDKAAVELTVYTLNIKSKELAGMAEAFRQTVGERNLTVKTPARQLYELLVKPAEEQLRGVQRLCIVPDGPLWNLPFQASHQGDRGYLLEQYALFYAPSLSVLREMGKRATALRATHQLPVTGSQKTTDNKNPQRELLALGNPTLAGETITKVRFTRRDEPLNPLPDAEKEVNFLGRLYGPRNSRVLIGEQAREVTVKAEAGNYEILHFATHAVLDDRSPLYSRIILSRPEGDNHEDGLLEAWEIMKLDLNAELSVLSACQTARGHVAAGEGVIGMSWSLFVAGSPAAVVSQWKVDSARSAELMIAFHQNLRQRKRGGGLTYTRSESLRHAALKLLRGPFNHPAYWAGFILIGDDR